jgi:hypothetical protein
MLAQILGGGGQAYDNTSGKDDEKKEKDKKADMAKI